uniref:DUF4363 domain-containing protein n=1 Tax=Cyanothece sp. (strain PCC 7425 / ATCC 29141) TaxID=395961 RepID=B8HPT8_CYAP4
MKPEMKLNTLIVLASLSTPLLFTGCSTTTTLSASSPNPPALSASPRVSTSSSPSKPSLPVNESTINKIMGAVKTGMGESTDSEPPESLEQLNRHLLASLRVLKADDVDKAQQEYEKFDDGWDKVEDEVKDKSREGYEAIEDGMDQVKDTLVRPDVFEKEKAIAALETLSTTVNKYATEL